MIRINTPVAVSSDSVAPYVITDAPGEKTMSLLIELAIGFAKVGLAFAILIIAVKYTYKYGVRWLTPKE